MTNVAKLPITNDLKIGTVAWLRTRLVGASIKLGTAHDGSFSAWLKTSDGESVWLASLHQGYGLSPDSEDPPNVDSTWRNDDPDWKFLEARSLTRQAFLEINSLSELAGSALQDAYENDGDDLPTVTYALTQKSD